jgi:DNA-binding transcriptional LysR family regulator
MEFTLDQLRTLAEIARDGSFSRAAERRHLSQPAVSHQIRELERRAGSPLLDRIGKKAVPTPAGRALLIHITRVLDELAKATETLRLMRGELSGLVRVGTGATASTYLLPRVLAGFHARHPRVEVQVVTGNSQDLARDVLSNKLDIALVTLPVQTRGLSTTVLCSDTLIGIAAPRKLLRKKTMTSDDFSGLPLVLYEPGGTNRKLIEAWLGRAKRRNVVLELGNIEAIKRTVQAGLGLSIVPSIAVRDEARSGTLQMLRLRPSLQRKLALVVRPDRHATPVIGALREAITAISDAPLKPVETLGAQA